jgi:hypothetical protein
MQDACVREEPQHFFVPPYVGPSGWLGLRLDKGLAWNRVAPVVRAAYERVAPARLTSQLQKTPSVPAPKKRITAAAVDPKNSPRGKRVLAGMCSEQSHSPTERSASPYLTRPRGCSSDNPYGAPAKRCCAGVLL